MAILLTFHALLVGTLLWTAASAWVKLGAERKIFEEFNLRGSLRYLVLMYPLAPVFLIAGTVMRLPGFGGLLACASLIPGLVAAYATGQQLETSGTDRTKKAATAVSLATTGAVVGLIYVALVVGLQLVVRQQMSGV